MCSFAAKTLLSLCSFAAIIFSAHADADAHTLAREAQRAWRSGDPATAAALYDEALGAAIADKALEREIRFNAALAHLRSGETEKAAELFRSLSATDSESAEGLGVALFNRAEALGAEEKLKALEEAA
ncbi:MAG: hypothetical protein FWG05_01895, partial [Kiritimatiellaeota bacterium]|nr:hypothetical protein [Kiritimatiellota bacterium]